MSTVWFFIKQFLNTPYLLKRKTRFFFNIWLWNMWDHLKFTYEAMNQIAMNWTMRSQTKAYIAKSSCEICTLLRYHAEKSGSSIPTFWDKLLVPSPRVKKSKRENTAQLKLTETIFFFETLSIIQFFKGAHCFRSQVCFHFQARST